MPKVLLLFHTIALQVIQAEQPRSIPRVRNGCSYLHNASHVTRHTSHATRHTSHVTRHTPHVTRHAPLHVLPWILAQTLNPIHMPQTLNHNHVHTLAASPLLRSLA